MKNWIIRVLTFMTLSVSTNVLAMEVHGHRGARARFPENTLPAFSYALKVGVDFLEMDIAVTRDKKLVISHEPFIVPDICLGPDGHPAVNRPLIHSLTLSEVKAYDCGSIRNARFSTQTPVPGTRIPTLEEVFDMVEESPLPQSRKIQFNIETKIYPDHPEYTVGPEEFVKLLYGVIQKHHMVARSVIQSFDYRTLVAIRKIDPKIRTSALSENRSENLVKTGKELHPTIVSPDWEMLNKDTVEELHKLHIRVLPWTANDPQAWDKLIDMKVDGIISDDPERLIEYLKTKHLR